MVTFDHNIELCRFPTIEEVKKAIFALSGDNASSPNGFTDIFYQEYSDIIGEDILNMLLVFYGSASPPKSIKYINLVLLPKKPMLQTFLDLRPISLKKL